MKSENFQFRNFGGGATGGFAKSRQGLSLFERGNKKSQTCLTQYLASEEGDEKLVIC
jgi:hypothetical protein